MANSWDLPSQPSSLIERKSGCGSGLGELPKILRLPFNISATAGANDFKFCMPLEIAKAHHKITPGRKSGRGPGLGELPKFWRYPFNIHTMTKDSNFKIGRPLGFAKAHHKIPHQKVDVALGYSSSPKFWGSCLILVHRLKLATSNLAYRWGLLRPTIKPHSEEKVSVALGLVSSQIFWVPL